MSIYALKPAFQAFLRPFAGMLARAGVTANQVTIAAAVISVAVGALAAFLLPDTRAFLLIPAWMFVRMACNALDGMLAREHAIEIPAGRLPQRTHRRFCDAALYLPFALCRHFATRTGVVIALAITSEYAGVLATEVGATRRYDGPMGKSDRAFVFGALGLWVGLAAPLPEWAAAVMPVLAVALIVTIVNRVRAGLRESR